MIRAGMVILFLFYFLHLISEFFLLFCLISCYFIFVSDSNYPLDVWFYKKILLLVLLTGVSVFKFGECLGLFHTLMFPYFW
jgi:hypothetical protein